MFRCQYKSQVKETVKVEIELIDSVAKRLRKIADESDLSVEDVVRIAAIQFVGVPIVPEVLSPIHVYWPSFVEALAQRIVDVAKDGEQYLRCDGTYENAEDILDVFKKFGVSPNMTIEFFKKNGVYCDCAILEFAHNIR